MPTLAQAAAETLEVLTRGAYTAPSGASVWLRDAIDAAVRDTVFFRATDGDRHRSAAPATAPRRPQIEVTLETTAEAGRRLVEQEGVVRVAALGFASAVNPGGGFLVGAKAQEEDLARSSALYHCLRSQRDFYDDNRRAATPLYTHGILHSPDVPFFRDERLRFLERPFLLSIVSAPAPNAGLALAHDPTLGEQLGVVLEERAARIVAVAADRGHRTLILGAWGCGAFRNDATQVAEAFGRALADERLAGAFDRIVFAIRDPGGQLLRPFERRFGRARL